MNGEGRPPSGAEPGPGSGAGSGPGAEPLATAGEAPVRGEAPETPVAGLGDGDPRVAADAAAEPRSAVRWLWLSLFVVLADQATKALVVARFQLFERLEVLPFFDLTRLHNYGAAFSFLADASGWQHYFFVTLAFAVSAGIVWWLSRLPARGQGLLAVGLAAILGGALGNVIDRLVHGHVVDFLHFHWREAWYFPAFNLADTAITIGAALLILDALLESRRATAAAEASRT